MRRLFIIRKDLALTAGKMSAMVAHCAECYWTELLKRSVVIESNDKRVVSWVEIDKQILDEYINNDFVKTICEAKNLNHLMKASILAEELGLKEKEDYGFIDDKCLTELTPEFVDDNGIPRCRVGMWFRPLSDETSKAISKKYQLFKQ